ncbi:MAG: DinB superfamily protein [Ignavibacteria bacterium CG22_combo_CG10-13_8_21_14_all_37_15]|nr:DinB family protein [Ignavibacteria bacterium]OIO15618.1 MAG: DinB superfamily protein [Ignavibacteria bacterium CG1_02_37_35]PIP78702.1 MAG: DinB superfamily protein [Ignavibacteria bacterium CG22_combo_CG10-13_8_21_14_all_37_15]PIS46271.1 MAG: DinB superfamily protein [Ignavibacteria bacterium CG08_land_8_20_14_0_20_37_9]PJC57515.1 MAG: DinB superfamily protein [Ignavibacteria bacterium CG_4_9_14_0_2_um_filter_37_13]
MFIENIITLFNRDLNRLKSEIELYKNEKNIWLIEKNIANSAGNLCLHLIGNLNWFIGAELGKTNYVRHRELEFSTKDIPQTELIKKIDETIIVVENSLRGLTDEELKKEYPLLVFDKKTSTEYFLLHLTTHLAYHLGQINYHRRLLDL